MADRDTKGPAGGRLGPYRLLARLGSGGMAEVYLAREDGTDGLVAVKRMKPLLTASGEFVDLFAEEARIASLLRHPNVCRVDAFSRAGRERFLVMEYLEGVPLSRVLALQLHDPRTIPLGCVLGLFEQACAGLDYAHSLCDEAGRPYAIVHRDVSPPNLFVTSDGVVKLLDFGISKSRESMVRTLTGHVRGKFSYMSPEQLAGARLDRRSDVFALAVVLFELVTGSRLFKRRTRLETLRAITDAAIPRADHVRAELPAALADAIDAALARRREERTPSAAAFAAAVRRSVTGDDAPWPAERVGEHVRWTFAFDLASHREWIARTGSGPPGDTIPSVVPLSPAFDATTPGVEHADTGTTSATAPRPPHGS